MTFFSRCEPSGFAQPAPRGASPRAAVAPGRPWQALLGFAEDLGILVRYAAGLDYYGRQDLGEAKRRSGP